MVNWISLVVILFGIVDLYICEYLYKDPCIVCNTRTEYKNLRLEPLCEDCRKKLIEEENKNKKAR